MVKTDEQFQERGCDNCDRYVQLRDDKERVQSVTSSRISGFIGMIDPQKSWVGR